MYDQVNFRLSEVFLSGKGTERFARNVRTGCEHGNDSLHLYLRVDRRPVVTVRALKMRDGSYWVDTVRANLPALLHGHNGRQLRSAEDHFLSLTRLRHVLAGIVKPDCTDRLLPGIGAGNLGYIRRLEAFAQFHDVGQRFLLASHNARLKHQQKPTGVFYGESTCISTRLLKISIYDKAAETMVGQPEPPDSRPTRVEVCFNNTASLVREAINCGVPGNHDGAVATLAPGFNELLVTETLGRLAGFRWLPEVDSLADLPRVARLIASTLGSDIHEPNRLNEALTSYERVFDPGDRTLRDAKNALHAYAVRARTGDHPLLTGSVQQLTMADVHHPSREHEFQRLCKTIGLPDRPDPDVAAAWSKTSLLAKKPEDFERIGLLAPGPLPFPT